MFFGKTSTHDLTPVIDKYNPKAVIDKTCISVSEVTPTPYGQKDPKHFSIWGDFIFVYGIEKPHPNSDIEVVYFTSPVFPLVKNVSLEEQEGQRPLMQMNKDLFDLVTAKKVYDERMKGI